MKRTFVLLILAACFSTFAACAGLPSVPGLTPPKAQVVDLNVGQVCATCSKESHATLAITDENGKPIQYKKVGITEADNFVESANKVYGTTLLLEKMVGLSKEMAADPNKKVAGFNDPKAVMTMAQGMFSSATTDVPKLISDGTALATNLPGAIQSDPVKALVLPDAIAEVNTSVDRLKIAQEKLTGLAGAFSE